MNNLFGKILILILVFTTITFGVPVPLNSNRCNDQGCCPTGFGRCIDTENDATKILPILPRFPKLPKLPKLPNLGSFIKGPSESPIFRAFDGFRGKTKTSGTGKNKKYFEWDFTHNDIEVYDNKGKHLGSMDPKSGNMTKPPVDGRKINI